MNRFIGHSQVATTSNLNTPKITIIITHKIKSPTSAYLALSCHISIYTWNFYFPPTDKGRYMTENDSFAFLWSYFDLNSLVGTAFYTNVFMNVLFASSCHLEGIIWTYWRTKVIYMLLRISVSNMGSRSGSRVTFGMRKRNIIPCVLRTKINFCFGKWRTRHWIYVQMNLENVKETPSEESSE
jgi:hypothetical protein